MANYGGNSFPFYSADSGLAERIPLWDRVDEQLCIGSAMLPEDGQEVGKFWPAGTPIEVDEEGGKAKLGADATKPTGLTRADVVMGEGGCTFAIVTRGKIRASLLQTEVTEAQREYLKDRILFGKEHVVTKS